MSFTALLLYVVITSTNAKLELVIQPKTDIINDIRFWY